MIGSKQIAQIETIANTPSTFKCLEVLLILREIFIQYVPCFQLQRLLLWFRLLYFFCITAIHWTGHATLFLPEIPVKIELGSNHSTAWTPLHKFQ